MAPRRSRCGGSSNAPDEAAAGAVWLIYDQSSYDIGAVFPIDGGIGAD